MNNSIKRLRRAEVSIYLKEQWGISRTPGTLAKLAVIGGGPKFQHDGRIPLYPQHELDQWAESALTPLKTSTSDLTSEAASLTPLKANFSKLV